MTAGAVRRPQQSWHFEENWDIGIFRKLKTPEGDQCSSGFTRSVLSLGAVVGDWTTTRIKHALDKTPVKLVKACSKEHLPVCVQAQRRLAFSLQIP